MKKKDDKTESGPTFYRTPNGKFLPSVYASALGRYYPLGGKMGETSSQWYPTYSPITYNFLNDVNRFGTEIGFQNPNIAGKKFFNKSGMTVPFSYTHHEDYGQGFGPALSAEKFGPNSNFSHFGSKEKQRFDEARIGLLGKSIRSNIGGARGFSDVYAGYGASPYLGIDAGAKWNLNDWGNKKQNHADTTLHLLNAQIGDKYGYSPNEANQIFASEYIKHGIDENKTYSEKTKLSPGFVFSPGISGNVSHAVANKNLKGLEFGAKGSAKINLANQVYNPAANLEGNLGEGQGATSGKFNRNPIVDFSAYARYKIPDRKKEDKRRVAEKAAKDKLINFPEIGLPHATGEGVDFSRPRESFSQPLWGGRPWHEVEMIPEGILNKSIYPYSKSQFPYGGTFDMPRQQMYMPLDHVTAKGGYLAPILPMHFDKGTQIYRDTTEIPNYRQGGKLMDFPAASLSEREANINYNVYASMPGRYYGNGGQFLTAGGEYHRIYKNAEGDIMVNHPAEDKGKWDTINLTDKSGANTVAQGVATTKQWHSEHPNAYGNGGMIKRADGSYSQRGLWDNIRANKGSGKEPTKEMLAQERKIRANEHAFGGNMVRTSHLFGMGGHKAVFFPTNVSEPGAADKDLTYPKDAYVYANGGHLYDGGGPVYTYAGRPNAKYRKENDKWLISIDGGNKFKPIYDPKGERTALLNAQAKPIITTNYDPLTFNQISDNTRTVIPNQAVSAMNTHIYMESPEYKAKQKAEKEAQTKFEKEQWNKYKNASTLEKVGDRVSAFASDPLGMTARAITGEQAYFPGMGIGLVDNNNPDRERYLKAVGYTPGKFEVSDFQNLINPGYWANSIGTKFATGHPIEGAAEAGLIALGLKAGMPGTQTAKKIASGINTIPEFLTTIPLKNKSKILADLPKLESVPKFDFTVPEFNKTGFSPLEKKIYKHTHEYVKNATSAENYARAAALDAEYGTEYVKGLKDLEKHLNSTNEINKLPFNIKIVPNPETGEGAWSGLTEEGKIKRIMAEKEGLEYKPTIFDREIAILEDTPLEDVKRRINHEIKHHYTLGKDLNFYDNKYGNDLSDMLNTPGEISKTNPVFADELIQPAFKDDNRSLFEYLEEPREIDAYVNTNLRDELVDKGILKNHWDELDNTKIAKYLMGNPHKHTKKYLDLVKDAEFIKNFNKGVYSLAVPAVGIGAATLPNKFKQENGLANGGHLSTAKTVFRTSELF